MSLRIKLGESMNQAATARYHEYFDSQAYLAAIQHTSVAYRNALLDEALAICGSPFYKLSRRQWSKAAQVFLMLFVTEEKACN